MGCTQPTVRTLRDDVEVILGNLIGSYQLNPSTAIPAIFVTPPQVPSNRIVTGLEVIISRTPDVEVKSLLNKRFFFKETWTVTLIQRDSRKTTHEAIRLLLDAYLRSRVVTIQATEVFFETSKVYIPSMELRKRGEF